jgi:serine/threonine-protein kinase
MIERFVRLGCRHRGPAFEISDAVDGHGRRVVLKEARALDALGKRRFQREARLGRDLKHGGLASVLDDDEGWIAFEPLEGSLASKPRINDLAEIHRILERLASTFAHLHARGVVHRDLKPAHVMFRGSEPVIIDLGVAGLVGDDPLEGTEIVGSVAWMAPEQAFGANPDPSADIWSFCAVAHYMLTGQPLFCGSADAVLDMRRAGAQCRPRLQEIDDPVLTAILAAGLGPAGGRPSAAEIANRLAGR